MAIEPIFKVACLSNTGLKHAPALDVFHTPPDAEPIYQVLGLFITTSMAVIRPLMPEGPMLLGLRFLNCSGKIFWANKEKERQIKKETEKASFISIDFETINLQISFKCSFVNNYKRQFTGYTIAFIFNIIYIE